METATSQTTPSAHAPRAFPRTLVAFSSGDDFGVGESYDVSATGIFVLSEHSLPAGRAVDLKLHLAGSAPGDVVELRGEVVRASETSEAARIGFAVRFSPESASDAERFRRAVMASTVRVEFRPEEATPVVEGEEASGRFELLGLLGSGSTSDVFRARDLETGRIVALKVLNTQAATDGELVERLRREAALVRRIGHPRIAEVLGIGTLNGFPYLSMELVEGSSLARVLFDRHYLTEAETLTLMLDVTEGLAAAHHHDVVHRDLKPSNLMVTPEGRAKVLDFGIARARLQTRLTLAGAFIGTPLYAAPEQLVGATASPRTDVYGLGCVLFRSLTGLDVQDAPDLPSILELQYKGPSRSVRDHRSEVSDGLAQVVRRCLARDPADRFANAAEVRTALSRLDAGPLAIAHTRSVRHALVGEPDPGTGACIRVVLERAGFEVRVIDDGFQLVEIALASRPSLVVAASTMTGIGGLEVIQILRSNPRTAGLGLVLTSASESDREAVSFEDTAKFAARPITDEALDRAVRDAWASASKGSG